MVAGKAGASRYLRIGWHFGLVLLSLGSLLWMVTQGVQAKSLGSIGPTSEIQEADLLSQLSHATHPDRLQAAYQKARTENAAHLDRPTPVAGLHCIEGPSVTFFDLGMGDISPNDPSSQSTLAETLLFYNADDPRQVRWAKANNALLHDRSLLILVGGSVTSQRRLFQKSVYFDQGGRLCAYFGLQAMPCRITQHGRQLAIQAGLGT